MGWMSLRQELFEAPGPEPGRALGTSASAHDLVGVLHEGPVDSRKHLFDVARFDDALLERGVVGFVGSPALMEHQGAWVLVVSEELERLAAIGGPHAVPPLGEQPGQEVFLAGSGVEVG
jgi:hypothetical protein